MEWSPLIVTLETAVTATFITFFLGIGLAYGVVRLKRGQGLMDALITLPMVLPPTVVGFFLLLAFGKRSAIGQFLLHFDLSLVFSWQATVIAAVVVSLPLMYRTARGAFEQLDENIIYAARTLGVSEWRIFWHHPGRAGAGLHPGPGRVRRHHHVRRQYPRTHPDHVHCHLRRRAGW